MYTTAHLSGLCLNEEIPVDWLTTDAEPHDQERKQSSRCILMNFHTEVRNNVGRMFSLVFDIPLSAI